MNTRVFAVYVNHRKTCTVKRYESLGKDVFHPFRRSVKGQDSLILPLTRVADAGRSMNVAGHAVPANLIRRGG